jgi:NAD(P) transhydrogenase
MQGTKDHFHVDLKDDVVRGSIVLNNGVVSWPPNPPISVSAAPSAKAAGSKLSDYYFKAR